MRTFTFNFVSVFVGVLIASGLFAQSETISLSRALELSKQNNLTLQQQTRRLEQARAALAAQKAEYFPTVSLNGSYNYISELAKLTLPISLPGTPPPEIEAGVNNQYDLVLQVQQPLFTGFRTRNLVKSAAENIRQAEAQKQAVENRILLQIHSIYYSAQLNELQQRVLQTSRERLRQQLQVVKNLFVAGQATGFDTLKMSNQLLDIQTKQARLGHVSKVILSQLALVLNVPSVPSVEKFSAENLNTALPAQSYYLKLAEKLRPEFAQFKHQFQTQMFRKKALQSRYFPQLFARAGYHYARPGVNFFKDEWMKYYTIGLNLQWELWHRGKTGRQVKQAEYSLKIIDSEAQKLRQNIRQQVIQTYENLLSDREQIELTRKLVLQEQKRYRITRDKFEQGLATTIEVSDAENALTAAQLQLQVNYINWLKDQAQMSFVTGQIGQD